MNAVGSDVFKRKNMVAVVQPFGIVVAITFEISHNGQDFHSLCELVQLLTCETKVVMEYTSHIMNQ